MSRAVKNLPQPIRVAGPFRIGFGPIEKGMYDKHEDQSGIVLNENGPVKA